MQAEFLKSSKSKALILTLIAGCMWGTSFPAIKIGLQYMDAYTFVFLRFLIASLTMLFISGLTKRKALQFDKKRLVIILGISNGIAYLLQYMGMVFATATESSLFVNLSVVWVALISPIALKEKLSGRKMIGVIVSLLGVVLMTTNLNFSSISQGTLFGDLLVISAGALWAFFIVYNKPLIQEGKNIIASATWLLIFTLLPLTPIAIFFSTDFVHLPINAWIAVFYTAIFCWVIPYYLWLKGLRHISAMVSSIVLLTEIIVAALISTFLLGETLTIISALGATFIIIAIMIVS